MARVFNLRHSIFKGDKFAHFHQQVTIRAGIKRARGVGGWTRLSEQRRYSERLSMGS